VSIAKAFETMGAKVRVIPSGHRHRVGPEGFTIDIARERGEEIFEIRRDPNADLEISVVDRQPKDRHLLLMVKREDRPGVPTKQKFLCGHDEMHWFVAPVSSAAADVRRAKEALKPSEVVEVQEKATGKRKRKAKARGGVRRQGEWFFIPKPKMKAPHNMILKDEPIRREGGGKPHIVEEVYRMGGDTVYEGRGGHILEPTEFRQMVKKNREAAKHYRAARVNAKVFGRGKVRHPDHSTIVLEHWYQIVPNAEHKFATRSMRFVD
jgi:hypothetical protein